LHWWLKDYNMKCPNCNETLVMADRQGVEIDYCPKCRGVWLDRGELDKLMERTAGYSSGESTGHYPDDRYRKDNYYSDDYYKRKKKKGFLGDFFDFD
jgi:uncharacterized protein